MERPTMLVMASHSAPKHSMLPHPPPRVGSCSRQPWVPRIVPRRIGVALTRLQAMPSDEASLAKQIQQVLQAHVSSSSINPDAALQHMLTQQQALYKRELARWDEERAAWDRKEAAMQEQIRHLQDVVVSLALQQAAQGAHAPPSAAGTPPQVEVLAPPTPPPATPASHDPTIPSSPTSDATTTTTSPPWASLFTNTGTPSTSSTPPTNSDTSPGITTTSTTSPSAHHDAPAPAASTPVQGGQTVVNSVVEHLQAAIAAVEQTDVLVDDLTNFHAEWVANGSAGVVDATTITSTSSTSSTSSTPTQPPPTPTPTDHSHPPVLVPGSDDIFWMSKLHAALATQGFHSGDEDMEDWYFGPSTQSALLTFQACNGLEESGVTDQPTWRALLGEQGYVDMVSGVPSVDAAGAQSAGAAAATRKGASRVVVDKWPTLHEGDGGRFVHAMHVLLEQAGYWPGEDDFQWWWFGDGTLAALKAYQSGQHLPESGVCDAATWQRLMGPDAQPDHLNDVWGDNDFDADLGEERRGVFLIGEQRWEDPMKIARIRKQREEQAGQAA